MKKIKRIFIAVLILLVVGAGICYLTFRLNSVSVSKEKIINKGFTEINVKADYAGVKVYPTSGSETKIKLSGKKSSGTKLNYTTNVEGKTLSIKMNVQKKNFFHFDFLSTLYITVYVPEKQYEWVQVQNEYGSIKMDQLNVKSLKAKTKNGEMDFNHMKAKNADIQSVESGPISFHGVVTGKIAGKTHNGKITLDTPNIDYPIQLETYNGAITIRTDKEPKNVTYDLESGSVNIFGIHRKSATVGNGENLIKLKAHSGKIKITK